MKKYDKKAYVTFYLISIAYYVMAMISYMGDKSGSAVVWMCMGSAMLCVGTGLSSRGRKDKDQASEALEQQ